MQRVLSFQMARGFGESSEFVTKRMCFSFLFSVGFLCMLCGFLLGRFATERTVEFRAQKRRLEWAGNGLESTEYLQHMLLHQLGTGSFVLSKGENDMHIVNGILSNLSFIQQVSAYKSCIVATVRGSRESDRYVVLSVRGEGTNIALELAKILNTIHEGHAWEPRRSLLFCISFESIDHCPEILSAFVQQRILAYVAMHDLSLRGSERFIVSGSDVTQSIVLQVAKIVQNLYSYDDLVLPLINSTYNDTTNTRTSLGIPHVTFSFANDNVTYTGKEKELQKIRLAQIFGQTIWSLSECLIIKWDPYYFNKSISTALESISNNQLSGIKEKVKQALNRLVTNAEDLNKEIDTIESANLLKIRIFNDLLVDLDKVLLCPDKEQQSRTNWPTLLKLSHEPSNVILIYLNEILQCYETAIQILHEH